MIELKITSDSMESLKKELTVFLGAVPEHQLVQVLDNGVQEGAIITVTPPAPTVATEKKTRTRAEKPAVTADPLASVTTTTVNAEQVTAPSTPTADPLASTAPVQSDPLATTSDPLANSAPSDPLAPTPSTPATKEKITFEMLRAKIAGMTDKRPQIKQIVASYKKADGTPCGPPSELQEKDYAAVYSDLDFV